MAITIRLLDPSVDTRGRRAKFRSGNNALDRFLETRADKNQRVYGVTYVAVEGDPVDGEIVGYVTVAASSVKREAMPQGGGPPSWPVLLLGRMAVVENRKGEGIGEELMRHVFRLALEQADRIGCAAVIVDAKPGAETYYVRFGFEPLIQAAASALASTTGDPATVAPAQSTPMYVLLETVSAAIKQAENS